MFGVALMSNTVFEAVWEGFTQNNIAQVIIEIGMFKTEKDKQDFKKAFKEIASNPVGRMLLLQPYRSELLCGKKFFRITRSLAISYC